VIVSAILSSTKNGVAILVFLGLFLALVLFFALILQKKFLQKKNVLVFGVIFVVLGVTAHYHQFTTSKGWENILIDVATAIDIEKDKTWQKLAGSVEIPKNSAGEAGAASTYYRAAWAAVGVWLISKNPYGYGSINDSFVGLQKLSNIPNENNSQTHSGWIDFGLAFGIPGLVIVFLTLSSTIYLGLRSRQQTNLVPVVICITLLPFCLIAEMSYKQYFESLIFFIALSASLVVFNIFTVLRNSTISQRD
jgi:O-antigen ligase